MLKAMPAISIYNFLKADEEPHLLPASPPPKQGYFIIYFLYL
jgi:hypothetical protein